MSQALYSVGDRVYVNVVFDLRETIYVIKLDKPIVATISVVGEKCSEPFGYAYTLRLPDHIYQKYNVARVCYWESDILCKEKFQEDLIWQLWGDQ